MANFQFQTIGERCFIYYKNQKKINRLDKLPIEINQKYRTLGKKLLLGTELARIIDCRALTGTRRRTRFGRTP